MATTDERTYVVEGMSCGHCQRAVIEEVEEIPRVEAVDADVATGRLTVRGEDVDDTAVRNAVAEAGYRVAA